MTDGESSRIKWFVLAFAGMMALCLVCAAGSVFALRFISSWMQTATPAALPTTTVEATATSAIAPTEPARDPDRAREMLETLAQTVVPINEPIELAERLRGLPNVPRVLATEAEPIPLGTIETFWVGNVDTIENFQVQADLVYATDHVYFWVEQGVKYDLEDVKALVDDFETHAYPTNRAFFGSEWSPGVDGDPHLYILYARNLGASVAGYFSAADELSPLAHEYSNGHEMFYLSADNVELWEEFTYSVLAHEFQHMIHWSLDRNEESWLNEGFSELASFLNGYDIGGWDFAYASDPDLTLTYWPTNGGPHYGQSFLFVAYMLERFGPEVTQAVVAHPNNGLDSIDQTLAELGIEDPLSGAPVRADDLHRDWAVALLLQDPTVADGRYAFESYVAPQVQVADRFDECPFGPQERQVSQYGIDYIRVDCAGEYTLLFDGASEVQVLPAEPLSGEYAFWSNRGDESDMTLTRSFDLQEVSGPIELRYWTWYDIEEGWDYLYLEISADGGETWQILETPSGTAEDSSGNSYGWGYTGYSGGGSQPAWIQEKVDLSAFAGQEILLRFEYITDAAVNGDGFLLDDIRIDALGYFEDFEAGDGGWRAEGFVRLYNRLPQTYQVILVEHGDEIRVRPVALDAENSAEIEFQAGDGIDYITLIVSGTARHTWQPAPYRFELRP